MMFCFLMALPVQAKEYGVLGATYVIAEQDFLEFIQQRLKAMQENGELKHLQDETIARVKAHVIRPDSIHLPRATHTKTMRFDPSITAPFDLRDTKGQLIVTKGTVINPLTRVSLTSTLLFFDGDDNEQIAWVKEEIKLWPKVKLIATKGSIKEATHEFKDAVYFDLNAFLVTKFQIKALPARVVQDGLTLNITEVAL